MRSIRCEIDDLALVDPKHPVHAASNEQREMSEGAEATIGDQNISRLQGRRDVLDARHFMRAQGGGHDLQEKAGTRVKQSQNLGNREAASRGLSSRLAKVGLQLGSIGHGK